MSPTAIHRMVDACRRNDYPALITRMSSGWAVMGQAQFLRGYSLLLPDPVVPHLNDMAGAHRDQFLKDMVLLGDAVLQATQALRINYAMFGNVEPALHAHVMPRFVEESPALATAHPWMYDWQAAPAFSVLQHGALQTSIRVWLDTHDRVGTT